MNVPYNIVCVSDEGYVQHAAVMLCSLFETNEKHAFCVYFLTTGISEVSKERLESLCRTYQSKIQFITCPIDNIADLPVGQWNIIMYLKLFIPIVLPKYVTRCLFLDVDMVINDKIEDLYTMNLGENVLAAAEDIPDCQMHKLRLGMADDELYINSGVMVCDVAEWRKMEALCPIFTFVRSISHLLLNEQDVIALYFRNRISCLPIRWNMVTFYFNRVPKIFPKYLPNLLEAKRRPGIIHFAAPIKPWFRDSQHPYRKLYRKYLALIPWANEWKFPIYEQLTPRQRFNRHIKNLINRIGFPLEDGFTPPVR